MTKEKMGALCCCKASRNVQRQSQAGNKPVTPGLDEDLALWTMKKVSSINLRKGKN